MSRKEIVGEIFTIAFGVDHVTGAFVQLWNNPASDQDSALVVINSDGISNIYSDLNITSTIDRFLKATADRFQAFQNSRPGERPNITEDVVIDLARIAGGFPDITSEVYKIFGGDA